jgi:hypothetical protein
MKLSISPRRMTKLLADRFGPLYAFVNNNPLSKFDVLGLDTRYIWSLPPCGPGLYTSSIQIGFGGVALKPTAFVDDGLHGLRSDKAGCPPLYPGSLPPSPPGNGNLYDDRAGNALGTVGLNGLRFEVCRVCLAPCKCMVKWPKPTSKPAVLPGYRIASVGPCRTYVIPGTSSFEDLDDTTDPSVKSSPTASAGFKSVLTSSYPNALDGGCFQCDR